MVLSLSLNPVPQPPKYSLRWMGRGPSRAYRLAWRIHERQIVLSGGRLRCAGGRRARSCACAGGNELDGTNTFTGSGSHYYRNDTLNARAQTPWGNACARHQSCQWKRLSRRPLVCSAINNCDTIRARPNTVTYLFSRPNHDLLEMFAWSNVLLAFDYDGTLAPLVNEPARATMRVSTDACSRVPASSIPAS